MLIIKRRNKYEELIWWSIICTIPIWVMGGVYILGSILGWILCILKIMENRYIPKQNSFQLNLLIVAWLIGALILLVSLLIGHYNFELGLLTTIKSTIGWAKGWALFPLYIIGGLLPIRQEIITRAVAINCIYMLCVLVLGALLYLLGVEGSLFTSPLRIVSPGNSEAFFDFSLFYRDLATNALKIRLFTPWSPALGLLANIYFWIIINETNRKIKMISILSVIILCIVSGSRAAILGITVIPCIIFIVRKFKGYLFFYACSIITLIFSIYYHFIITVASDTWQQVRNLRSDSSRVRSLLTQISLERWLGDAFWWGHGIVVKGPKLVEYTLIGTHNTWVHLLYAKGFIGLIAFLLPMLILLLLSLGNLLSKKEDRLSTSCLGISMVLWQYTISENLEMLVYLYWPGLILVGICIAKITHERAPTH